MATVNFSTELQKFTNEAHTQISSTVYRDMLKELELRYPLLKNSQLAKMAVAIDGVIIVDPFFDVIPVDGDVYFLHFIAGG
ncbi:MAG: hypothetical protein ACI92E_001064 [Oceanicoccus sp.]|jgi:hypothetical protein